MVPIRIIVALIAFWHGILHADSAVTYTFSGGRFGDNLISYVHAKWISYQYGVQLLYKPFQYSDQLKLHAIEESYKASDLDGRFARVIILSRENISTLKIDKSANVLYVVPYFPESRNEPASEKVFPRLFDVDWTDVKFVNLLRLLISPRTEISKTVFPVGYARVAVHVRKKSGDDVLLADEPGGLPRADVVYSDVQFPYKVLPDDYYIEQIIDLNRRLGCGPMYVYLFTDINNPQLLVEKYSRAISANKIIFNCRQAGDHHKTAVVEDFFAMAQFDYLIRSDSNFSLMAGRLNSYRLQVYPRDVQLRAGKLVVSSVEHKMALV